MTHDKQGSTYVGDFKFGVKSGTGEYTWKEGNVYKGEFKNNKMHG